MEMNRADNRSKETFLWGVVVFLILVTIAYVSESFLHFRLDFTEGKQYTLSDASRETLQNLKNKVTIKAVFSENLPAQFARLKTHVEDLLHEFESDGNGNIQLRFEDPGLDSLRKKAVLSEGIKEIQVTEQNRGGAVAKRGFFGMTISYQDKKEVVPIIENLESFEYDLIVKIKKLTGGRKKLGVVEGSADGKLSFTIPGQRPQHLSGFKEVYSTLNQEASKLYDVQLIDASKPIPEDVSLLLVAAPKKLSTVEKFHIDQFAMKGRNIIFMTPNLDMDFSRGLHASLANSGYKDLLQNWGFKLSPNLILDTRHGTANFGISPFGTPYPPFISVQGEDLNRKNVVSSGLGSLLLPWMSSLDIDTSGKDFQTDILAKSSSGSWEEKSPFDVMPKDASKGQRYIPSAQHSFPLIALRRGKFSSLYASGIPMGVESSEKLLQKAEKESSILVIPNFLFASDFFVRWSSQVFGQNSIENIRFVVNAFDYLALDPRLISIRSKGVKMRPIQEASFNSRYAWISFNLLFAPFIIFLLGVWVFVKRRKAERKVYS